jgi:hypothetical protein
VLVEDAIIDPLQDETLPNITSGLGLGYRRMIKPELYLSGGREHVRMQASGIALAVAPSQPTCLAACTSLCPTYRRWRRNAVKDEAGKVVWSPVDKGYIDWLLGCGEPGDALEGWGTPEASTEVSWAGMKKELDEAKAGMKRLR